MGKNPVSADQAENTGLEKVKKPRVRKPKIIEEQQSVPSHNE